MNYLRAFVFLFLLSLAACGSGSGGSASGSTTSDQGSLRIVLDTRAGSDSFVQFHVVAATLEAGPGAQTGNLLPESVVLTFGDPTGEPVGLRLANAPPGTYTALHLVLDPGSGVVVDVDGSSVSVSGPIDLRVPIAGGLQHSNGAVSWVVLGHDAPPLTQGPSGLEWHPRLTGRLDGEPLRLAELAFPVADGAGYSVTATDIGDGVATLRCSPDCVYEDDDGSAYPSVDAFQSDLSVDDSLEVDGELRRDGRIDASRLRRGRRNEQPRLIGRVQSIDAGAQSFELRVLATRRRGGQIVLQDPEDVFVRASTSEFELASGAPTTLASLVVGQLVKVEWTTRTVIAGGSDEYVAREVELLNGDDVQPQPEWEGRVQSVDTATSVIVVVPRNDDPIIINGESVDSVSVVVGAGTELRRKADGGGGEWSIELVDVQPGVDRIWVRGTVSGPMTIEATRVRVRED